MRQTGSLLNRADLTPCSEVNFLSLPKFPPGVGGSARVRYLLQLLRDGVLVSKQHLVAEVFVLPHTDEIVQRVKTQGPFAFLEKDEHLKTRKVEFVSNPLTGSSGIVKVFPASLVELFEIIDFAFHFDSDIDIGGSFRAP
jgi:hypothetical protein